MFNKDETYIVIEPGHYVKGNGLNTGAVDTATGLKEFNLNTEFADALEAEFIGRGFNVIRASRKKLRVRVRAVAKVMKAFKRDKGRYPIVIWLSLHQNSFSDTSANGSEVFISGPNSKSRIFAGPVLDAVVNTGGFRDRGIKYERWYMLRSGSWAFAGIFDMNTIYAMLIEFGFISNPDDRKALTNVETQSSISAAIAEAVAAQFGGDYA